MNKVLGFIDKVNVPGRWMHGYLFNEFARNAELSVTRNVLIPPMNEGVGKRSLFCRKMIHGCSLGMGLAGMKLMLFCHLFMMLPGVECKFVCVVLSYLLGLVVGGVVAMLVQISAQKEVSLGQY